MAPSQHRRARGSVAKWQGHHLPGQQRWQQDTKTLKGAPKKIKDSCGFLQFFSRYWPDLGDMAVCLGEHSWKLFRPTQLEMPLCF